MNSENSQSIKRQLKQWLAKLDPSRRDDVEKLWEEAGKADESRRLRISDKEKKDAFSRIAAETGISTSRQERTEQPEQRERQTALWRWYAAAAIILLAAGLSYLTIPIKFSVPYGETAELMLPDSSRILLNSGTTITYSRLYDYLEREVSLEGEAFFEVQKGELPFTVHTSNATVKVLGTRFNLRSWQSDPGSETVVTLQEGSLAFYAPGRVEQSVILKPGERSSIQSGFAKPTPPVKTNIDESTAWMENRFAFERKPMGQIIREIERRYNTSIAVQPAEILSDTLTIYYNRQVELEQIIQDICQSKALNYREINGGYIIEL